MNLNKRKEIIQKKRKNINFENFLMEICSWYPLILNKRKVLSRYPDTDRSPNIISNKEFFKNIDSNDKWGINYNFEKTFFDNFKELFIKVPLSGVYNIRIDSENSDYADIVSSSKNVYLSFNVTRGNENILYSLGIKENGKNILNSIMVWDNSEIILNSYGVIKSFKIFYSKFIYNSNNIWFSSNLVGCSECIFCDNLENKSYYINNKKLKKEEYEKQKKEILKEKEKFDKYFNLLSNIGKNLGSDENIDGIFALNSENIKKGIFLYNVKNAKNVILSGYSYGMEEIYDTMFCGAKNNCYGALCCGKKAENIYSCFGISGGNNLFYSYNLSGCSYCIGCIGLRNKSFYILNKKYSKDERFQLADKIFEQMNKNGILGDFFPGSMNPFYFNDTIAYLIDDSFTKKEIEKEGYLRRDEKIKVDIPEGLDTVQSTELNKYQGFDSNGNRFISPDILKKVIIDQKGNSYRVIKMEYDFLIKYGLPLPEIHWLDRIKLGFKFKEQ